MSAADGTDLWDAGTGNRVHHTSGTRAFVTTLNGSSVTGWRRLRVWDVATGRELLTLPAGFDSELRPGTGTGSVRSTPAGRT